MSKVFTMRNGVLLCMAIAIICTAFAPDVGAYSTYVKDVGTAATGIAALFMHPPTLSGATPPDQTPASQAAGMPAKN